ncbi:MAG: DUF1573 domain-containing protein [Rikenellaceae bacterium]
MKYILLIISFLTLVVGVTAKELEFAELTWDFGTIEEEGGSVTHTFEFENTTSIPVVIHNIRTSCGCTTPVYSRKPIGAGEKSTIEITFDPKFRPGTFKKDIYVYNTATEFPIILEITGTVTPRVLSLEERYPYTLGDRLRIGTLYTSFRAVPRGRLVQQSVEFKNTSKKGLDIEFRLRDPKSLLQLHYDRELKAGEGATLEVGYYLEEDSSMAGRLYDTIDIYVDGMRAEKMLYIKGLIVE